MNQNGQINGQIIDECGRCSATMQKNWLRLLNTGHIGQILKQPVGSSKQLVTVSLTKK